MNQFVSFKNNIHYYLKIISLFFLGYVLVSHYRPFQNKIGFFDFGLADSGVGLVSLVLVYFVFTPPIINQYKAKENVLMILFVYLSQEIFCYFFPGLIGSFDVKDLVYYIFGFILVYCINVRSRGNNAL